MSTQWFSPEFKDETVKQLVERGYCVAKVAARLGASAHSLHKWTKAITPTTDEKQAAGLIEAKSKIVAARKCGAWEGTRSAKKRGKSPSQLSLYKQQCLLRLAQCLDNRATHFVTSDFTFLDQLLKCFLDSPQIINFLFHHR